MACALQWRRCTVDQAAVGGIVSGCDPPRSGIHSLEAEQGQRTPTHEAPMNVIRMHEIPEIDGMSLAMIEDQIYHGGRFVRYSWVVSPLVVTIQRPSRIYYLKPGEDALRQGLPYTAISLLFGWWAFPRGITCTFDALQQNLGGGEEFTRQVLEAWHR